MKTSLLILCLLFLISCDDSKKVLYHDYYESASDYVINKWNLSDTIGHRNILKETVDESGRVQQLEFFENGKYANSLCYLANRITYKYRENLIIETLFWGKEPVLTNDCEMSYKRIYHLDKKKNYYKD